MGAVNNPAPARWRLQVNQTVMWGAFCWKLLHFLHILVGQTVEGIKTISENGGTARSVLSLAEHTDQ